MAITPEVEAIRELAVALSFKRPTRAGKKVIDGRSKTPLAASVDFVGAVQPVDPRKLRHLPEGQDARDIRVIFTETELRVGDEVIDQSELFIVQEAEFWREGEFFEVTMLRRSGSL